MWCFCVCLIILAYIQVSHPMKLFNQVDLFLDILFVSVTKILFIVLGLFCYYIFYGPVCMILSSCQLKQLLQLENLTEELV